MILKKALVGKNFFFLLLVSSQVFARVHDFQTTRLKSTGGAGVGSVLMNESVVLNPAPLAVFNVTTATYQRDKLELKNRSPLRNSAPNGFSKTSNNNAFILAEGANKVKGAVGYFDQEEGFDSRKRVSTTIAGSYTEKTALGINYKFTQDVSHAEWGNEEKKYHSFAVGLTHFVDPALTFGILVDDPGKSKDKNNLATIGIQYITKDLLTVMIDVGSDYKESLSDKLFYKVGGQLKLLGDFYLRSGIFYDKAKKEKGNGWGLGWIGPRLGGEFAVKNSKPIEDPSPLLYAGETLKEVVFSLSYVFGGN